MNKDKFNLKDSEKINNWLKNHGFNISINDLLNAFGLNLDDDKIFNKVFNKVLFPSIESYHMENRILSLVFFLEGQRHVLKLNQRGDIELYKLAELSEYKITKNGEIEFVRKRILRNNISIELLPGELKITGINKSKLPLDKTDCFKILTHFIEISLKCDGGDKLNAIFSQFAQQIDQIEPFQLAQNRTSYDHFMVISDVINYVKSMIGHDSDIFFGIRMLIDDYLEPEIEHRYNDDVRMRRYFEPKLYYSTKEPFIKYHIGGIIPHYPMYTLSCEWYSVGFYDDLCHLTYYLHFPLGVKEFIISAKNNFDVFPKDEFSIKDILSQEDYLDSMNDVISNCGNYSKINIGQYDYGIFYSVYPSNRDETSRKIYLWGKPYTDISALTKNDFQSIFEDRLQNNIVNPSYSPSYSRKRKLYRSEG